MGVWLKICVIVAGCYMLGGGCVLRLTGWVIYAVGAQKTYINVRNISEADIGIDDKEWF